MESRFCAPAEYGRWKVSDERRREHGAEERKMLALAIRRNRFGTCRVTLPQEIRSSGWASGAAPAVLV